jgi:hypothetical protein
MLKKRYFAKLCISSLFALKASCFRLNRTMLQRSVTCDASHATFHITQLSHLKLVVVRARKPIIYFWLL